MGGYGMEKGMGNYAQIFIFLRSPSTSAACRALAFARALIRLPNSHRQLRRVEKLTLQRPRGLNFRCASATIF
jgi:hypothetical protein